MNNDSDTNTQITIQQLIQKLNKICDDSLYIFSSGQNTIYKLFSDVREEIMENYMPFSLNDKHERSLMRAEKILEQVSCSSEDDISLSEHRKSIRSIEEYLKCVEDLNKSSENYNNFIETSNFNSSLPKVNILPDISRELCEGMLKKNIVFEYNICIEGVTLTSKNVREIYNNYVSKCLEEWEERKKKNEEHWKIIEQ